MYTPVCTMYTVHRVHITSYLYKVLCTYMYDVLVQLGLDLRVLWCFKVGAGASYTKALLDYIIYMTIHHTVYHETLCVPCHTYCKGSSYKVAATLYHVPACTSK